MDARMHGYEGRPASGNCLREMLMAGKNLAAFDKTFQRLTMFIIGLRETGGTQARGAQEVVRRNGPVVAEGQWRA